MDSSFINLSAERPAALVRNIETRLVADLFYHAKGVVVGTLVLFAVNLAFYFSMLPNWILVTCSVLLLGSCAIRTLSLVRYHRAEPGSSNHRAHNEVVVAYIVMAGGWGFLSVACVVVLPPTESILAIITAAGITGAAAATTSASPVVFKLVGYIALAPLALALLLSPHDAFPYVGVTSACYLLVLNRASARIHETLVQSVTFGLKNEELVETLARQSTIDSLTGLNNRRALNQGFQDAWQNAVENNHSVGLILCDIDHFKEYNDTHGHLEGDYCLQRVAAALQSTTRSNELMTARYGGEEFAVLLPYCTGKELEPISERLRTAVHSLAIPHGDSSVSTYVTISVGASYLVPVPPMNVDELIREADNALYLAKDEGRNCVQINHVPTAAAI